ncbi:MAG TPA: hypothetical protein VEI97_14795 [bacterium]|nr:hypothetical protein [bacterium]
MGPRVDPCALFDGPPPEKVSRCMSGSDGECFWKHCPQLRDGEPERSHRHCPLDRNGFDDEE